MATANATGLCDVVTSLFSHLVHCYASVWDFGPYAYSHGKVFCLGCKSGYAIAAGDDAEDSCVWVYYVVDHSTGATDERSVVGVVGRYCYG